MTGRRRRTARTPDHLPGGRAGRPVGHGRRARRPGRRCRRPRGVRACRCWWSDGDPTSWWPTPGSPGMRVMLDPAGFGARRPSTGAVVRAGGAVPLPALARQTVEAGLTGLEWAVGVPGSVGGGGADERRRPRLRHRPQPARPAGWSTSAPTARRRRRVRRRRPALRLPDVGHRPDAGGGGGRASSCGPATGTGPGHHPRHRALAARNISRAGRTPARCSPTRRASRRPTPPAG